MSEELQFSVFERSWEVSPGAFNVNAAATRTFGPYQVTPRELVQGATYTEGFTCWGQHPLVCVGLTVGANTNLRIRASHDGTTFLQVRQLAIVTAVFIYKATCAPAFAAMFDVQVENTSAGVALYGITIFATYTWALSVPVAGADL